jgi:FdhD protein
MRPMAALWFHVFDSSVAADKIASHMRRHDIPGADKIFHTTRRLTSKMIIRTVRMDIPIIMPRSGRMMSRTGARRRPDLIDRARGKRFVVLSCLERIVFGQSLEFVADESGRHRYTATDDDG